MDGFVSLDIQVREGGIEEKRGIETKSSNASNRDNTQSWVLDTDNIYSCCQRLLLSTNFTGTQILPTNFINTRMLWCNVLNEHYIK